MSDFIDRLHELATHAVHTVGEMPYVMSLDDGLAIHEAIEALESQKISSAQPEPQWILCSERMPEEHEWIGTKRFGTTISSEVYVTFEAPDGERFATHISFQNGKLSSADEQRMKAWFRGAKPIAWMPLPEPWEGGSNG